MAESFPQCCGTCSIYLPACMQRTTVLHVWSTVRDVPGAAGNSCCLCTCRIAALQQQRKGGHPYQPYMQQQRLLLKACRGPQAEISAVRNHGAQLGPSFKCSAALLVFAATCTSAGVVLPAVTTSTDCVLHCFRRAHTYNDQQDEPLGLCFRARSAVACNSCVQTPRGCCELHVRKATLAMLLYARIRISTMQLYGRRIYFDAYSKLWSIAGACKPVSVPVRRGIGTR
jgi:hypothetical protein